MSDNEIYLLVKYIKSFLWRVAKRLSHTEDARCLKVKPIFKVRMIAQPFKDITTEGNSVSKSMHARTHSHTYKHVLFCKVASPRSKKRHLQ